MDVWRVRIQATRQQATIRHLKSVTIDAGRARIRRSLSEVVNRGISTSGANETAVKDAREQIIEAFNEVASLGAREMAVSQLRDVPGGIARPQLYTVQRNAA